MSLFKLSQSCSTRPKSVRYVDDPVELVNDCSLKLWTLKSDKKVVQSNIARLTSRRRNLARALQDIEENMKKLRLMSNQYEEQLRVENKLLKQRVELGFSQQKDIEKLKLDIIELGEAKEDANRDNEAVLQLIEEEQRVLEKLQEKKLMLLKEKTTKESQLKHIRTNTRITQKKNVHANYRLSVQRQENSSLLFNLMQNE